MKNIRRRTRVTEREENAESVLLEGIDGYIREYFIAKTSVGGNKITVDLLDRRRLVVTVERVR